MKEKEVYKRCLMLRVANELENVKELVATARYSGKIQQSEWTCDLESGLGDLIEQIERLVEGKEIDKAYEDREMTREKAIDFLLKFMGDDVSGNDLINLPDEDIDEMLKLAKGE